MLQRSVGFDRVTIVHAILVPRWEQILQSTVELDEVCNICSTAETNVAEHSKKCKTTQHLFHFPRASLTCQKILFGWKQNTRCFFFPQRGSINLVDLEKMLKMRLLAIVAVDTEKSEPLKIIISLFHFII